MAKGLSRSAKRLPRNNLRDSLPTWQMLAKIEGRSGGERNFKVMREFKFLARCGGVAKSKALPKLQGWLESISWEKGYKGSPSVNILLRRMPQNGNGSNNGIPKYTLKPSNRFLQALMRSCKPAQVFTEARRQDVVNFFQ